MNNRTLHGSLGLILLLAAVVWLATLRPSEDAWLDLDTLPAGHLPGDAINSGTVAPMHSPAIVYSPGWRAGPQGADPAQPDDPWREPAGSFEFTYHGQTLALLLAKGDYWGYVYVTVDGKPASQLAYIPGNVDSRGAPAGYTTLYAPEQAQDDVESGAPSAPPVARWLVVHQSAQATPRQARVEVWRSWGQTPVRGIAVDALPPGPRPLWPGVLAATVALALLGLWLQNSLQSQTMQKRRAILARQIRRIVPARARRAGLFTGKLSPASTLLALLGIVLVGLAVGLHVWWLTWIGLMLLGAAALWHPAYWLAALAFCLPFYYAVSLPLLPARAFGLLDVGIALGLVVVGAHKVLANAPRPENTRGAARKQNHTVNGFQDTHARVPGFLLWALIAWALVCTVAADYLSQARYEWRTVFLAAGFFWLILRWGLGVYPAAQEGVHIPKIAPVDWVLGGWLAGGALMAALALGQYASDAMLITAEGVARVRGLYGSPNNLALYLERTLMVSVGLALYLPRTVRPPLRGALWLAALIQLGALLLTFSKGALLVGAPAGFALLWIAGPALLTHQGRSRRPLWALLGLAAVALLLLTPFLGAERFRNVLDLSQGTGFLRIQLWRSALAMGWDHPWLGVGPDNFLYAFRSHYLLPAAWQEPDLNHPHNLLLDGWTRLGLPGLLLLLSYLGLGIIRLGRRVRRANQAPAHQALAAGCLAAAVAGLAHGLIDVSYALPDLMLVWVLLFHLPFMARAD